MTARTVSRALLTILLCVANTPCGSDAVILKMLSIFGSIGFMPLVLNLLSFSLGKPTNRSDNDSAQVCGFDILLI